MKEGPMDLRTFVVILAVLFLQVDATNAIEKRTDCQLAPNVS